MLSFSLFASPGLCLIRTDDHFHVYKSQGERREQEEGLGEESSAESLERKKGDSVEDVEV